LYTQFCISQLLNSRKHIYRNLKNINSLNNNNNISDDRLINCDLTAFSAQIGYIVPLISILQLKSEISEKVDNVT